MTTECAAWIGFAGNATGALLAGAIALGVMFYTTRQTREIQKENKKNAVKPILIFQKMNIEDNLITDYGRSNGEGVTFKNLFNIGNGCAIDIEIECDLDIDKKLSKTMYPSVLSNNKNYEITLISKAIHDLKIKEKFTIIIKYTDIYKNPYKTEYTFEKLFKDHNIIDFKYS